MPLQNRTRAGIGSLYGLPGPAPHHTNGVAGQHIVSTMASPFGGYSMDCHGDMTPTV